MSTEDEDVLTIEGRFDYKKSGFDGSCTFSAGTEKPLTLEDLEKAKRAVERLESGLVRFMVVSIDPIDAIRQARDLVKSSKSRKMMLLECDVRESPFMPRDMMLIEDRTGKITVFKIKDGEERR
jgi:hypothetical protein